MPLVDKLYDWLAAGSDAECDRTLGAALESAEPDFAERIMSILYSRDTDASWAGLVGCYSALPDELLEEMRANRERLRAAIAQAIRLSTPTQRLNALSAYDDDPTPTLAYVLPAALRDPTNQVRSAAACTLRAVVEHMIDRQPGMDAGDEELADYTAARRRVVQAVNEGLRTFDLHFRIEVLEAGLWLATDLGDALWEYLENRRSRAGNAVNEKLDQWNNPKLAGFLLSALAKPNWHRAASRLLRTWSGRAEVAALLAQTPLLADPEIRKQLPSMRNRGWLDAAEAALGAIPAPLRTTLPKWLLALGYSDQEKVGTLSRWSQSRYHELSRAATYALADVQHPGAVEVLTDIAESGSPAASFARWFLFARQVTVTKQEGTDAPPPEREQPGRATDFAGLWQVCRRKRPSERVELIELIRENASVWRTQLLQHLQSPDPRDRVMVLQVISTDALLRAFAEQITALANDPVEPIRKLAESLLLAAQDLPRTSERATPQLPADEDEGSTEEQVTLRRELDDVLRQLLTDRADPSDPMLVRRVRMMLRKLYGHLLPANYDPVGAAR
ncbi:MAG: hypothetical protein U1D55_14165 [Phycisphaerae bacterium]